MVTGADYQGQVVLVTGGATGLGFAMAAAFAVNGARVALNDLTTARAERAAQLLREAGAACLPFAGDVRDGRAVKAVVQAVEAQLGVPDVVVANAGIYPNTPFLDLAEEEWDRVIDTNLKGVFLTAQAGARAMVAAGKQGCIVTISSGAANTAYRGWSHYCTSKAAVVMLTRAMALELAEHGIRVNAVLPGYIDVEEGGAHLSPRYREAARAAIPFARQGTPEDIANAVLLLASPLAGYVSGATLAVDGAASAGRSGLRPVEE